MNEKIAIVCSGGGMSCSYSAGVLSALARHYRFEKPDIAIGGSGSAGSVAYYVAGQYDDITKVWSRLLSTKKFINKWRFWRIINIDYLIDCIFKSESPLDVNSVYASQILFFISAVDYDSGNLRYFSNKDLTKPEDIFEIIRASKAMPVAFNKRVEIQGKKYCDSYLSSDPNIHIIKAIESGASKIIVAYNWQPRHINEAIFKVWLKSRDIDFRRNYYRQISTAREYQIPENVEIIKVSPSSKIKVDTFRTSQRALVRTIQMGYDDAVRNPELNRMFR